MDLSNRLPNSITCDDYALIALGVLAPAARNRFTVWDIEERDVHLTSIPAGEDVAFVQIRMERIRIPGRPFPRDAIKMTMRYCHVDPSLWLIEIELWDYNGYFKWTGPISEAYAVVESTFHERP